jgi:catechol 2,3-dioxygenase-like lactoylglutathione lyase family enzyme
MSIRRCYRRFPVSRVQLALNVADLDAAIDFYSKLFATEPAKIRPGYANFTIAEPPLKLVLIEHPEGRGHGTAGALNHLGVEVETSEQVQAATARLTGQGLEPEVQESTTCCYALQDQAWVDDPDGAPLGVLHGAGRRARRERAELLDRSLPARSGHRECGRFRPFLLLAGP